MRLTVVLSFAGLLGVASCARPSDPAGRPAASAPAPPASRPGLSTVYGKAPVGAIVSLEPVVARQFDLPAGPAVLDQYGKQFVPPLLVVRVGQPVEFLNSDDFGHNVIVNRRSTGAAVFNTSLDNRQKYTHVFERAGEYSVTCDLHEGMLATIFATTSPFAVPVNPGGAFAIMDVPPGSYRLTLVVSGGGSTERTVEVSGDATEVHFKP